MGGEEGVSLQRIKAISRMSETIKVNTTCHDLLKMNSQSQEFLTSLVEERELRQQFPHQIGQDVPQQPSKIVFSSKAIVKDIN